MRWNLNLGLPDCNIGNFQLRNHSFSDWNYNGNEQKDLQLLPKVPTIAAHDHMITIRMLGGTHTLMMEGPLQFSTNATVGWEALDSSAPVACGNMLSVGCLGWTRPTSVWVSSTLHATLERSGPSLPHHTWVCLPLLFPHLTGVPNWWEMQLKSWNRWTDSRLERQSLLILCSS